MDNQVMNTNGGELSPREQGMNEYTQMSNYFTPYDGDYVKLDELTAKINELEPGIGIWRIVVAVILFIIGVFWAFLALLSITSFEIGTLLFTGIVTALHYLLGIFLIKRHKSRKASNAEELEAARKQYQELSDKINNAFNSYPGLCPVGIEYTHPVSRNAIGEMIRQGRANNCAAAINLILDDMHKANMEAMAAETQRAAENAATNSGLAAAGSIASFLFK